MCYGRLTTAYCGTRAFVEWDAVTCASREENCAAYAKLTVPWATMPTDLQGRSSTAGPHEDASPDRWAWRWFVPTCFAGTVLFSLSVTQAPLYSGNQVTKFLHGFAQANAGTLDTDWLVSTPDPLPVFSSLVYLTLEWTSPRLFYLEFALLQAVYLAGLLRIALYRFQCTPTRGRLLIWFTALTVLHSRVFQEFGWLLINKRFFSPFTTGLA